jgi:hypothetical protein
MMTNEHEQNPHSNSTNQGGKFADQNVKPEAPATNDPWGIASVVASVTGAFFLSDFLGYLQSEVGL